MPQCQLCGYDSEKVYHTDLNETICEKCCSSLKSYAKKDLIVDFITTKVFKRSTVVQDFKVSLTPEGEIVDNVLVDEHSTASYLADSKQLKGNLIIAVAKKLKLIH